MTPDQPQDFIRQIVREDQDSGRIPVPVTRFPPEPNGFLHIGHAKSILLNFGIAEEFKGRCHLRYDDTNPSKEDLKFVQAIEADLRWLGVEWAHLRHASDYFEVFYRCAEALIEQGCAYVCDLNAEQVREYRGTLTQPGRNSPYRERSVAENLDLFRRMRAGEFDDGARTLRARIDMASGNINLRDPAIYRIRKVAHQSTGNAWPIYPMYDFAHCISDALEGITHSLCTLEFEDHRPLYDWLLDRLDLPANAHLADALAERDLQLPLSRPRQIEFSRLNLDHTVMSKRKLQLLVEGGHVESWDDPRLPTLSGLRRRGYTPASIRTLCRRIGISKQDSVIDMGVLEGALREDLDANAERRLAVLRPLRLVIDNLPETHSESILAPNHPQQAERGQRELPFSRDLWIEQDDFALEPPKGFHRLRPDGEVRLRFIGIVRCVSVECDAEGRVQTVHCTLDPDSRAGLPGADRKVKGTIHWVCARSCVDATVRLYDRLFRSALPDAQGAFLDELNPQSIETLCDAKLEPSLAQVAAETRVQFERLGYFVADRHEHGADRPVFNRAVGLRDVWARAAGR